MKLTMVALFSGIFFGIGLTLSQMVNPDKVLNFLDLAGNWDPSLIFVMLGALLVTTVSFRYILEQPAPLLEQKFFLASRHKIDRRLVIGAALFGIGWGLAGYCPGPAVAGLGLGNKEVVVMIIAIYLGFITHRYFFKR